MTWTFVSSLTMSDRPPTRFVTECRTNTGGSGEVHVEVIDDRIELRTTAGDVALMNVDQAANLRTDLGHAITRTLQDARTKR